MGGPIFMRNKILYSLLVIFMAISAYFIYIVVDSKRNMDKYLNNFIRSKEIGVSLSGYNWILTNAQTGFEENIELKGRKAIIAFATWCKPCLEKMVQYRDSVKPSDNVFFISDEPLELIQEFQKKYNLKVPLYKDSSDFTERFVIMLPSLFIIKDDSLLYKVEGPLSYLKVLDFIKRDYK
jgi:thiol-disulfide isomerase/thioredoxin